MSAMPVPRTSSAATVSIEDSIDFVDWKRLMQTIQPGSRFLSPIWFQSWESAFLNTGNWQGPVRYMTVRLNGRLSGVLTLVVQRISIVQFLFLSGYYMPFRDLPVKADMDRHGRSGHQFNGLPDGPYQGRSRYAFWPGGELQSYAIGVEGLFSTTRMDNY